MTDGGVANSLLLIGFHNKVTLGLILHYKLCLVLKLSVVRDTHFTVCSCLSMVLCTDAWEWEWDRMSMINLWRHGHNIGERARSQIQEGDQSICILGSLSKPWMHG